MRPFVGSTRLQSLDVLRGVAVLMVLAVHTPRPQSLTQPGAADASHWVDVANRVLNLGAFGVDLFFVLSGFLISSLLFTELRSTGTLDVPRFWLRRGLKIWPSYFVAYGSLLFLQISRDAWGAGARAFGRISTRLYRAAPNFVFLQTYVQPQWQWPASWSLAVEEHFYIALPLVLSALYVVDRRLRALPFICAVVCLIALLGRVFVLDADQSADAVTAVLTQTHFRMDGLAAGVLIGYVYTWLSGRPRSARHLPILASLLLAAAPVLLRYPLYDPSAMTPTVGFVILYLGFCGVVSYAVNRDRDATRTSMWTATGVLTWLGTYSYTIYLAQAVLMGLYPYPLISKLAATIGDPTWVEAPAFLSGSIIGGVVLSRAVERPFLRIRERYVPAVRGTNPIQQSDMAIGGLAYAAPLSSPGETPVKPAIPN